VLHQIDGLRWAPDVDGLGVPIEIDPEKPIKPGHVIHVEVGKKEVIDGLKLGGTEGPDASIPAIKEQPVDLLPSVHPHPKGVIPARTSQHRMLDHRAI
jgi:hypothetical protein